jgi:hypothetical protein
MNKNRIGAIALITVFAVSLLIGFNIPRSNAVIPVTAYESLPAGAVTTGMVYSGTAGLAYAVSYTYGQIYAITVPPNILTPMSYVTYQFGTVGNYNRLYYGLAVDQTGNLWVSRRGVGNDGTPAGLSKITLGASNATSTETMVINSTSYEWDSVGNCNSYIWIAAGLILYKVSPSTNAVANITLPSNSGGAYYGMKCDASNNLWFTDILNGYLLEYTSGGILNQYSGFSRPLGVAVSGSTVYVAENSLTAPAIAQFNTNTHVITLDPVKAGAVPYDLTAISGSVIYSVSQNLTGSTVGIGVLGGAYYGVNEAATYDLSGGPSNSILSSYYGSSGIIRLSDWQQVSYTTTTTIIHSTSTVFVTTTLPTTVTTTTITNTINQTNILVVQPEVNITVTTSILTVYSTSTVTTSTNTTQTFSTTTTAATCTIGMNC